MKTIENKGSAPDNMHSAELFYIEEEKLPFSAGFYSRRGCRMHWHHSWEILCQLEGKTSVAFGSERYTSVPGDITVISSEEPHETEKITEHHKLLLLQFQMDSVLPYFAVAKEYQYISGILLDPFRRAGHFSLRSKYMEEILWTICKEYAEKPIGYEIRIQAYIMEIMTYFLRRGYIHAERLTAEAMRAMEKVKPALSYVEENYPNNITLNEAAEMACLSIYSFCRTFKLATGYTFVEYLNYIRLKHAEKLLLSTKMSVSEIAYATGFSGLSYFNRRFKAAYSMGPSKYRKISGIEELECDGFRHKTKE